MAVQIRTLEPGDAAAYRELRLRALREHPEAFAASYEEERERGEAGVALRLAPCPERATLGAFDAERLVGIATLVRPAKAKLRHRAEIVAMYVLPEARARGVGVSLLEKILDLAREWQVGDLALAVTVGNTGARRMYARMGFVPYGIEPRSLHVGGSFHDVERMNLQLDPPATAAVPTPGIRLSCILRCPACSAEREETMPENACQFFYECPKCRTLLRPKPGDCCVFCSYGSVACPPVQARERCC